MAFPRKLLNEGEELVLDLKPHWIFLVPSVAGLVASVIVGVVVLFLVHGLIGKVLAGLVGLVVLVALGYFLARLAVWNTTHFVVTNRRLITGHGVFSKSRKEIPLDRVNDVSFHQGFLERMVGAGDLTIESAGERGEETFSDVNHPDNVQQSIYSQMEAREQRRFHPESAPTAMPPPPPAVAGFAPPPAPSLEPVTEVANPPSAPTPGAAGPPSIATQIEELHGLLQRGLISQAEFDAKKAQLLERM